MSKPIIDADEKGAEEQQMLPFSELLKTSSTGGASSTVGATRMAEPAPSGLLGICSGVNRSLLSARAHGITSQAGHDSGPRRVVPPWCAPRRPRSLCAYINIRFGQRGLRRSGHVRDHSLERDTNHEP